MEYEQQRKRCSEEDSLSSSRPLFFFSYLNKYNKIIIIIIVQSISKDNIFIAFRTFNIIIVFTSFNGRKEKRKKERKREEGGGWRKWNRLKINAIHEWKNTWTQNFLLFCSAQPIRPSKEMRSYGFCSASSVSFRGGIKFTRPCIPSESVGFFIESVHCDLYVIQINNY